MNLQQMKDLKPPQRNSIGWTTCSKFMYSRQRIFATLRVMTIAIIAISMFSCVSQKKIRFFQDNQNGTVSITQKVPSYKVQCGDVLFIRVQSIDEKSSAFINGPVKSQSPAQFQQSEEYLYFNGYEVGANGAIQIPFLDSIHVTGKTMSEIGQLLCDSLKPYIFDPVVSVKLSNFRVSVNGEVANSGNFAFYNSSVTIFDVVAMAKPTDFANRKSVVITRKIGADSLLIDRVDLTTSAIFQSPYYYMQPGDQIYFEPLRAKQFGFVNVPYALILSSISTALVLYTVFR